MSVEFCDTNVLVYAHDLSAGEKRRKALGLVERLWEEASGVISLQVLQEIFVTLARKIGVGEAKDVVIQLSAWPVVEPAVRDVHDAIDAAARWQTSFWDAMILVCASRAGAEVLWSEDLSHGQRYGSVTVRNPFIEAPPSPELQAGRP